MNEPTHGARPQRMNPMPAQQERYELLSLLGERSATRTWLAKDRDSQQSVVLKQLTLGRVKDVKLLEHFEREAEILSGLEHQQLPRLLNHFCYQSDEGLELCLVSTLMPGQSLLKLLEDGWRPQDQDLREIARQVLSLLSYLHERDPALLHRDLKPANILRDDQGQISLVDFGAARQLLLRGDSATVTGTFGYLAPEQFYGQALPESDLYALGVTLIHLLSGRHPADLPREGLKLCYREFVHADAVLLDWLDQLLAVDAEARPPSAKAALELLERPGAIGARPLRMPTPSSRIARLQQAETQVFDKAPQKVVFQLRDALLMPLPPILLWMLFLLPLGTFSLLPLLGWLMAAVQLYNRGRRHHQLWMLSDRLVVLNQPVLHLSQSNFKQIAFPDLLDLTQGYQRPQGPIPLNGIQGVYATQSRLCRFLPWLRFYGLEISCEVPLRGFFRLRLASSLSRQEQRWLHRELLEYMLRHQNEKAARQTLLQLRHLDREPEQE